MTLTKELMDLGASSVELLSELDPAIPALDEEGQCKFVQSRASAKRLTFPQIAFCFELTSLSASSTGTRCIAVALHSF